jgi:putative membrane protein
MHSRADSFDAKAADPEAQRASPTSELPAVLLAVFVAIWLSLAMSPLSRQDWLLENLLVLIAVPALVATRRRMRFSNASYICLFVFFLLHSIGAHYTYSLVPYDRWWQTLTGSTLSDVLGWQRNHYDRLVHFLYGVLVLPPAAELFDRYAPSRGVWRGILPVLFVMSHSVMYEIVEWIAALIVAPELGDAYLGTQGDPWDAQQDMALATLGAMLCMLFVRLRDMSFRRVR